MSILFSLKLIFWARKIRILENIFLPNKNWKITRARPRVQDFETGKNFSFNQYHNKELRFSRESYLIYKSNGKLFSCVCIAWYKHLRRWENSRPLCKPSTSSLVYITVSRILSTPLVFISCYANTENVFCCLNGIQYQKWNIFEDAAPKRVPTCTFNVVLFVVVQFSPLV